MKAMYWLLGIVLGVPLLYFLAIYVASELGGEVVVLDRYDSNSQASEVRIWIVDADGKSWIEHGDPDSPWVTQLSQSPELTLNRAGKATQYLAKADPENHALYHELRAAKYGFADQLIRQLTNPGECSGVPVQLQLQ